VGIVSETWWAYFPWSRDVNAGLNVIDGKKVSRKLSALELTGALVCITAGASWCRRRAVRCWIDNQGSVTIWQKGYSTRCNLCNTIVKAISTVATGIDCRFTIEKIRRRTCPPAKMADDLSKANFRAFRQTAWEQKWAIDAEMATLPKELIKWMADPKVDEDLGTKLLAEIGSKMEIISCE